MGKSSRNRRERQSAAPRASPDTPRVFASVIAILLGIAVTGIGVAVALSHQAESLPRDVQDLGPSIRLYADGDPFASVSVDLDARGAPSAVLKVTKGLNDDDLAQSESDSSASLHVWLIISDALGFDVQPTSELELKEVKETGDGVFSLTPAEQGQHTLLAVSFDLSDSKPIASIVINSRTPSFIHHAGFVVTPMPSIEVGLREGMDVVDSDTLAAAMSTGDSEAMKLFRAATIDGMDVYPPFLSIHATASPYDLLNPDTMSADVLTPQPSRYSPLGWDETGSSESRV